MSSWLDPFVDSLAEKLGLKTRKNTLSDAMRQDPGAESEVNRMTTGVNPEQWQAMKMEKLLAPVQVHGMEAVRQVPKQLPLPTGQNRPMVHLPPVNMVPEQSPRQMMGSQSTPLPEPVSEYQRPDDFTRGEDIIQLIMEAEGRSGIPSDPSAVTDPERGTMYKTAANGGKPMTEDEAMEYLMFLEGR